MPLEDIINKINEDARSDADSLLSLARAEADAIREKARKQAEELRAEIIEQATATAEEHANRVKILAGLDQRKAVLREKKKLIEDAVLQAKEKITNLPANQYHAFLKPLILDAVESGNEEIIPSSAHRNLFTPDFLRSLNGELGPDRGRLRLSEESGSFSGGFILREGNKETNLTLDSLMASKRDHLEPKIAEILFGEGKKGG